MEASITLSRMDSPAPEALLCSINQAARLLSVCPATIYRMIQPKGALDGAHVKIGSISRIKVSAIAALAQESESYVRERLAVNRRGVTRQ